MVLHLPSPKVAQQYRTSYLYEGPEDDEVAASIRDCNPKGPLILYVSKMVKVTSGNRYRERFVAFGRVFGGTISTGQKVRIMGPDYLPGKTDDLFVKKSVQRVYTLTKKYLELLADVPCGNIMCLLGFDQFLLHNGTLSNNESAHCIKTIKFSVAPVVRVVIEPKNISELPKLMEGLRKLSKSDPSRVVCTQEEDGRQIVASSDETHIELCLNDLRKYSNCEINVSDPFVIYKETASATSSQICLSKTPNKHNIFYATAEPLSDELTILLEDGKHGPNIDIKEQQNVLCSNFGWEKTEAQKIWAFGPEKVGPNILVDATKENPYMNEIKYPMETAFQWATHEGAMMGENLRSVRINIVNVVLQGNPLFRGSGSFIPTARRVYYAAELTAEPRIQEPIFLAEITAPDETMNRVYRCLEKRRSTVVEEAPVAGTPLIKVKAYLPVAEAFGLEAKLKTITAGQAFSRCLFHHWAQVPDDPFQEGTLAATIVADIRKKKGLKEGIPPLDSFLDKL